MNSRVSWSTEGIDPAVRERAEAAARRAGVSLSDWLNLSLGDATPPNFRSPPDQRPAMPAQQSRDVADIHQRLFSVIALLKPASEIQSEEVVEKVKRLAQEFEELHGQAAAQA